MDSFTFTLPTGPATVLFYGGITVPALPASGGVYVADRNTEPLLRAAEGFPPAAPLVVLEPGEAHKNLASVERVLEAALTAGLARDSLFVGVGGGVVCDMTAFAASLYMRGAPVDLVPTTLLAMADAAIGGKTGVDFGSYKNCVGSFHPARQIHVAVASLRTLPEVEYRSGLAEVLKTALLYAPKLYQIMAERRDEILARDEALLLEVVKRCVQAKARVVERDFREAGERMFLNLGHTFGHALETVAGLGTVTHGDAVAWGIARALDLGERLGVTDRAYRAETVPIIASYGWSVDPVHPALAGQSDVAARLLEAMKNDKKKRAGRVRFVLQREINSTVVQEVDDADVVKVLG